MYREYWYYFLLILIIFYKSKNVLISDISIFSEYI